MDDDTHPPAAELVRPLERPPVPPLIRPRVPDRTRSSRWIGPSAVASAVVVGGLLLWRFVPGNAPPAEPLPDDIVALLQESDVVEPPAAADPSSVEPPAAVDSSSAEGAAAPVEPALEERAVAASTATRSEPPPPSAHRESTTSHSSSDPAGPAHAYLTVQTLPWAHLFIDGQDTGRNTPIRRLRVPAGEHVLGLRSADGVMHEFRVVVPAGQITRVIRQL